MSDEQVAHWVAAWAHLRRLRVESMLGVPLVHVNSTSRRTEIVCCAPSPSLLHELLERVAGDRAAMLTVLAPDVDDYRELPLPSMVRLDRDDETFMSASLRDVDPPPADPMFRTRWDVDDTRATYTLEHERGIAAEGTVGLLGADAVLDGIETLPRFRHRGLGRHVVATLTTHAARHGATNGLLVASAQGRRLYRSAGWASDLRMLSWTGIDA